MQIRRFFNTFMLIGGLIWVSSCKDNDNTNEEVIFFTDAQISGFNLEKNDSVMKDLNKVAFLIDQNNGDIFNPDSLPYNTKFEKLLANITFQSAATAKIYTSIDTTEYSVTDSIDFTEPVKVIVTAQDKKTTKEYLIKVNVHQQQPDSMVWAQLGNNIYNEDILSQKAIQKGDLIYSFVKTNSAIKLFSASLADAKTWSAVATTSLPSNTLLNSVTLFNNKYWATTDNSELWSSADGINWTKTSVNNVANILGTLTTDATYLFIVQNEDGAINIQYTSNGTDYKKVTGTDNLKASEFPTNGYTTVNYTQGNTNYLSIIGGQTTTQSAIARVYQCSWNSVVDNFQLSNNLLSSGLSALSEASAIYYNSSIYLFGGKDGSSYSDKIYTSTNGGINWQVSTKYVLTPASFGARAEISIIESQNRLWFIGGYNSTSVFNDIWTAKINKLN